MEPQNQQEPQQPQVITPGAQQQPLQYTSGQLQQAQAPVQPAAQQPEQQGSQPTAEYQDGTVSWSASEFISHEKNGSWFAILIACSIILAILVFAITRELFSLVAIAILAVAVGVFGNLRPRVLSYEISPDGVTVGDKHFMHDEFKSFAIIEDGALPSLQLLPHKRFMVPITLYLDPVQADQIIETLGDYLPAEHRERDWTDRLSARFRF